jgi:DNA adenine methylase
MAFAGRHKSPSWAKCITRPSRGMALHVSAWISSIEKLEELHERLFSVLIEHQDFRKIIPSCDGENVFFYVDPPYVQSVRKGKDKFKHEMSDDDHTDLLNIILNSKGKFLISGYDNEIYDCLEQNGWDKIYYNAISWAAARTNETGLNKKGIISETQTRQECLWKSPNF